MKTGIIFSICFIALCYGVNAQDSAITTKLYAGILARSEYRNGNATVSANLHVGGLATWSISKKISYTGFAAVQLAKNGGFSVNVHFVEYRPNTKWAFVAGLMATLATEQRPHPVSEGGQFETWTQALIPGAALGVKAKRSFSENRVLGVGIATRNHIPEYHTSLTFNKVTIAGFYSTAVHGGAVTYKAKKVYAIGVYKNAVLGNTTVLTIVPKLQIKSFWDIGYDHQEGSLKRLEFGIMKSFTVKQVGGLFSIAYDQQIRSVTGYLFLYLK